MNNRKLVPAYLCVVLIVSNCAGGSFQANDGGPTATSRSKQQVESPTANAAVEPGPKELIAAVKRAYSGLIFYRSKGVQRAREEFRGKRTENAEIPFEIEYARGQNAVVKWTEFEHERAFKIEGKNSWLEVDGERIRTFSNPLDGLEIGTMTLEHENLVGIRYFVFTDELQLKDKFFVGLLNIESKDVEVVDGHECYPLTGTYPGGDARNTYWIDKDTGVIRRIERVLVIRTKSEGKEYVSTSTTTENYTDIEIRTDGA